MTDDQPTAPRNRTFSLNSKEFYEAVTEPRDPWVWAGGLPKEPKARDLAVVVQKCPRKR